MGFGGRVSARRMWHGVSVGVAVLAVVVGVAAARGGQPGTRSLGQAPRLPSGRQGFVPSSRELRGSLLRTRHANRSAPPVRVGAEVPWLRRAASETFVAGSGRLVTKISPFAVNYRTASGSFAPIDPRLVPSGSGFAQKANDLGVLLPEEASSPARVANAGGGLTFAPEGVSGVGSVSGRVERFAAQGVGPTLAYGSMNEGVDWQASLPAGGGRTLRWLVRASRGLSARLTRSGVAFANSHGKVAWRFLAPVAHVAGSARPVAVRVSLRRMASGDLVTMTAAAGSRAVRGKGRHGFAAYRPGTASAVMVGLANPYPVVFAGQVVPGSSWDLANPTGDCYVDSGSPDTSFCVEDTNYVGPNDNTLLNFDVADNIPAHAEILEAWAAMTLTSESSSTAEQVQVQEAAQPWDNLATWNTYDGTDNWNTPGGDATGPVDDTQTIGASGDVGRPFFWNVSPAMQDWVDGDPQKVYGLIFQATDGSSAPNTLGFATETAPQGTNPSIWVYYEPRQGDYPGARYDSQRLTDRSTVGVNVATGNLLCPTPI